MNLSEMAQTMTDDAKRIMGAFREAPVMTLQALTIMTGLSEHTTRFILEQLRQAGCVLDRHERCSLAEGDNAGTAIFSRALIMDVQSGRFWREEELCILKRHYPVMGKAAMQHLQGRNEVSVMVMARRLGLKKSRESLTGFRP